MGYQNFFATRLFTDIGASDTTIALEQVPTATSGRLVLEARNATQREIIRYTGISGNSVTGVTRGQGGTSAKSHLKNALVEMNLTAEDLSDALSVPSDIEERFDESFSDFVVQGTGVIALTSGLTGSFSDITYYLSGIRYTKTAIADKIYTASKDTYVFIDTNGNITYTEVANNATAPATPANNLLVAIVVTNATTITKVKLRSRGAIQTTEINWDSVGIEPRVIVGEVNGTTSTAAQSIPIPTGNFMVEAFLGITCAAGNFYIYDSTHGSSTTISRSGTSLGAASEWHGSAIFLAEYIPVQYRHATMHVIAGGSPGTSTKVISSRQEHSWFSEKANLTNGGEFRYAFTSTSSLNRLNYIIKCYKQP